MMQAVHDLLESGFGIREALILLMLLLPSLSLGVVMFWFIRPRRPERRGFGVIEKPVRSSPDFSPLSDESSRPDEAFRSDA
jgi:hypothetical protein